MIRLLSNRRPMMGRAAGDNRHDPSSRRSGASRLRRARNRRATAAQSGLLVLEPTQNHIHQRAVHGISTVPAPHVAHQVEQHHSAEEQAKQQRHQQQDVPNGQSSCRCRPSWLPWRGRSQCRRRRQAAKARPQVARRHSADRGSDSSSSAVTPRPAPAPTIVADDSSKSNSLSSAMTWEPARLFNRTLFRRRQQEVIVGLELRRGFGQVLIIERDQIVAPQVERFDLEPANCRSFRSRERPLSLG